MYIYIQTSTIIHHRTVHLLSTQPKIPFSTHQQKHQAFPRKNQLETMPFRLRLVEDLHQLGPGRGAQRALEHRAQARHHARKATGTARTQEVQEGNLQMGPFRDIFCICIYIYVYIDVFIYLFAVLNLFIHSFIYLIICCCTYIHIYIYYICYVYI